ncbi:probable mediator of RNA polymerase II transcription subunit 26b [Rutidosis leptorrhynchoides]|uniref:probable mediator of RNA polymerase II transcription subunit 26b n=1 Tax=Rutidosis leptorrhynchoides TaxID=125765 RepID=UPI003A998C77
MAASKSAARMDYWRDYFNGSNGDIFEIIEKAIMVAASDHPKEFRIRRDCIAQTLFNCKLMKCVGCDKVELGIGFHVNDEQQDDDDDNDNCKDVDYGVAEALTDEMEEESKMFGEVMRIKEIVDNNQNESESVLYNSLRKLQLMNLSVETLKATEIGKSVNVLRKHASKDVCSVAKTLIESWKDMVDEWVRATEKAVASEATPDSLNPSVLDEEEEGLPSPPLDDLAFIYPHMSMELSEFFDGMDENGNPGNSGGFKKNQNRLKQQKPSNVPIQAHKNEPESILKKKEPTVVKPIKPSIPDSGPARRVNPNMERKSQSVLKRPQQINRRASGEAVGPDKFEAAKRKLHERYQQAENAKKQRTIQVMELHDLPKSKGLPIRSQQNVRPGSNHNRHR